MIIPAGKKKTQMNQGGLKHADFLDNDFAQKYAIYGDQSNLGRQENHNTELDNAMSQGTDPSMSGRFNGESMLTSRMPGEQEVPVPDEVSTIDEASDPHGQSPASRFLGSGTDESNVDINVITQQEEAKVKQFIGDDFGLKFSGNKDGSFTAIMTPPQGRPIVSPGEFVDAFLQHVGGQLVSTETPDRFSPGSPVSVTYNSQGTPQKVEKGT